MRWLDVLNVAISTNNASELEELKMQGAAVALIQAFIKSLRDQVFNYKQAAEEILRTEAKSLIRAAGAMKVLEFHLNESGITPDLFQEFNDKEYAANAIKLIRENSDRLFNKLSKNEEEEVLHVASATSNLQNYNFYVDNYKKGKDLQEATEIVKIYKDRNGCLSLIGLGLYIYPGIAAPALLSIALGGSSETGQVIIGIIGFGLWGWGLVSMLKWRNGGKYKEAKKIVEKYGDNFNLDYFKRLDNKFGNLEEIKKLREEAQQLAYNFFGDAAFLPPRISPEQLIVEQEKEVKKKEVENRKRIEGYGIEVVTCPNCKALNSLSVTNCTECQKSLLKEKPIRNPYLTS